MITFDKELNGIINGRMVPGLNKKYGVIIFYRPDNNPEMIGLEAKDLPHTITDKEIINKFREHAGAPKELHYLIDETQSVVERLRPDGRFYFVKIVYK